MNILYLLLSCLFAVFQVYTYFSVGVYLYYRKIYDMKSIRIVSSIIYNIFLPIYSIMEINKVSSIDSLKKYWVLDVSCIVCIVTGRIFHYCFNLEERISHSFSVTLAFPSLGALPLVISKLLCSSGGPLEGEPGCVNVNGLMIFNFVINAIFLFLLGFILVGKDKYFSDEIKEKLCLLWHSLLNKIDLRDNYILLLLEKYLPNSEDNNIIYENFINSFHLTCDNNYNYTLNINENNLTPEHKKVLKKLDEAEKGIKDNKEESEKENVLDDLNNNSFFKRKMQEIDKLEEVSYSSLNQINVKKSNTISKLSNMKFPTAKSEPRVKKSNTKQNELNLDIFRIFDKDENKCQNKSKIVCNGYDNVLNIISDSSNKSKIGKPSSKQISIYSIFDHFKEDSKCEDEEGKLNIISLSERSLIKYQDIEKYYNIMFEVVVEKLTSEQTFEFYVDKAKIFQNLNKPIPIFPIVEGISVDRSRVIIINEEWNRFLEYIKENKIDIKLNPKVNPITAKIILSKIFSPPILGCFIGIVLGVSNMTNILRSTNHYFSNMLSAFEIFYKAFVPLVMITTGVTMFATKGLNINLPFTKYHLMITFLVRGVLIPFLGIGYMYLWVNYYGGIIKEDKVVRLAMYIPWALPSAQNYTIVVNLLQYYNEELGYVLKWHNALIFITITINLLIYFTLVGL